MLGIAPMHFELMRALPNIDLNSRTGVRHRKPKMQDVANVAITNAISCMQSRVLRMIEHSLALSKPG